MRTVDLTGLVGEGSELLIFAMFDFLGEPKFLHSGIGIVPFGGEDWEGVGQFGAIDAVRDNMGFAPTRLRATLVNPVMQYINEALNESTWGRLAELYVGGWDSSSLTATPSLLLRGRMGPPEVIVGGASQMSVMIEDIRAMMDRINGLRSTILEHQVEAPGDGFFRWMTKMVDHHFIFNGGRFGGNNFTPSPSTPNPGTRPNYPGTHIR